MRQRWARQDDGYPSLEVASWHQNTVLTLFTTDTDVSAQPYHAPRIATTGVRLA
jgi:hypothetical protein